MNIQANAKRVKTAGKVAAVLIAALGLYITLAIIHPIWKIVTGEEPLSHIFFLLVFPIPAFFFGGYCLFVAYQAWTRLSVKTVRRIPLIAAFMLCFMVAGTLFPVFKDSIWLQLITPLSMILAGIFYLLCSKLLTKWLCLQEVVDWSRHEKSVRRFLGWVAFFMWIACTHIIMGLVPKDLEYAHVPEGSLWAFIALLAPVLPIHLLYKACVRIVLSKREKKGSGSILFGTHF
ncbi:MAG: hypothetical protein KAT56_08020, partial [Sedimentisphaerales bacterium]|nr:hypothetical protein [Sedimentisphaerales bacterium]